MTKGRKNTCKPRKRTTPTKAERRLAIRQADFDRLRDNRGFKKPGSLKK